MIGARADLPEVLAALTRFAERHLAGFHAAVFLLHEHGEWLRIATPCKLPANILAQLTSRQVTSNEEPSLAAVTRNKAVFVKDLDATRPAGHTVAAQTDRIRSAWAVPLIEGTSAVGSLAVYGVHPGLPSDRQREFLTKCADIAALAICCRGTHAFISARESELSSIYDNVSDVLFSVTVKANREFLFESANRRFFEVTGLSMNQVIGLPVAQVIPEPSLSLVIRHYQQAIRERRPVQWEETTPYPAGIKTGEVRVSPVFDADGTCTRLIGSVRDITDHKVLQNNLVRMSRLYAALSQCNHAIMRCSSEQELFPQICRHAVQLGGLKMAWIGMVDTDRLRVQPVAAFGTGVDYLKSIEVSIAADTPIGRGPTGTSVREGRPVWCQDYQHDPATAPWRERGAQYDWRSSASLPLVRKGEAVGAFVVYSDVPHAFDEAAQELLAEMAMDISFAMDHLSGERERKQAIEDLHASELRLRTIIATEPECVKVLGRDGSLLEMNRAGLALLEADSIEAARRHGLLELVVPEHRAAFMALHQRVMSGKSDTLEFEVVGLKGTRLWLETHAAPMRDAKGAVTGLIGITRDISKLKRGEKQIQYLANFDMLTGLPNRNLLADHVNYAIELMQHDHEVLCVMFVDLDRFKDINDTLGHSVGDKLLIATGARLQTVLRKSDTVSRFGGDEFVLVLPDTGAQAAAHVADKLLKSISTPYDVGPYHLTITASIGIAIYPHDGKDLETLCRSADTAMYQVKRAGRNGYRFFTAEMQNRAIRHMRLTHAMHRALEHDQFYLHYQPQVAIGSGDVVGVEALLRWRHPEFGDVSPTEFIPVAEYSRLILPIGEWVLRTALRQLKFWLDHGQAPLIMAVNLSAVQFHDRNLPDLIGNILIEELLPPSLLELELTESVAMHDPESAIAITNSLHKHGVRMSIDDFGTGFSSLNYLRRFKVRKVKIDQSFIRETSAQTENRAIVAAIISMSKSLGLETIAEGVETSAQLAYLAEQGCDQAQGYYYCKPLPAAECAAFLGRRVIRQSLE